MESIQQLMPASTTHGEEGPEDEQHVAYASSLQAITFSVPQEQSNELPLTRTRSFSSVSDIHVGVVNSVDDSSQDITSANITTDTPSPQSSQPSSPRSQSQYSETFTDPRVDDYIDIDLERSEEDQQHSMLSCPQMLKI